MAGRKVIGKKIRFEVFKRDSFTCQYCGKSAPDIVLHVDHIQPVASGGGNNILNLVTSCSDCNLGKGARVLDDGSVVKKQIDQMRAINARQEQLAMLAEWRNGMLSIEENAVNAVADHINRIIKGTGFHVSDKYRGDIRGLIKRHTLEDIFLAIDKSVASYLKDKGESNIDRFLYYIPRICYWQKMERENPLIADVNRIVGIANKKWWSCDRSKLHREILIYHERHGVSLETIKANVLASSGIMKFQENMAEVIDG